MKRSIDLVLVRAIPVRAVPVRAVLARAVRVFVVLVTVVGIAACGRQAVRASEKKYLADPVMVFDEDPHESTANEHVRTNREGAAGGKGAGGGGCGCN